MVAVARLITEADIERIYDLLSAKMLLRSMFRLVSAQRDRLAELRHQRVELETNNAALSREILGPSSERMPPIDKEVREARDARDRLHTDATVDATSGSAVGDSATGSTDLSGGSDRGSGKDNSDGRGGRGGGGKGRGGGGKGRGGGGKGRGGNTESCSAGQELKVVEVIHEIADKDRACPQCDARKSSWLPPEISFEYEYVPAHFIRRKYIRHKAACNCGGHIVIAPPPVRVSDGVRYGPALHANVIVSKCADAIPLYRQAKALHRVGIVIHRSTLCDLFHRGAIVLQPIYDRLLALIAADVHVNADETSLRVLDPGKCRRAFIWTFIARPHDDPADVTLVAYVFSANRSGETPSTVLGDSEGTLQVDGYSGYNRVCTPVRRTRIGCLAHARRYFFKALETAPDEASFVLRELILELYVVEYDAAEASILGTDAHLHLRKSRSKSLTDRLATWLREQKPLHAPKSPLGRAITYTQNNWTALTQFLGDPKLALDNNISERMLRIIALGRKNFLFVGHNRAGENLATLQSLVATCEANGINPQHYLADVLIRVQSHPASRIDELLPHRWKPPSPEN